MRRAPYRHFRDGGNGSHGQKWIHNPTRCAIYARDNFQCLYCGVEGQMLDHVTPKSESGGNEPGNLATCCNTCNQRKGERSLSAYVQWLDATEGTDHALEVESRVLDALSREIDRSLGRALEKLRPRGTFAGLRVLVIPAHKLSQRLRMSLQAAQ